MQARTEELGRRHGVRIATIAHAGDGNLHPLLITPPGDDDLRRAAHAAFDGLLDAAIGLGGTWPASTVGLLKRDGMRRELGPEVVAIQHAVKPALDPLNLFNPGKAL